MHIGDGVLPQDHLSSSEPDSKGRIRRSLEAIAVINRRATGGYARAYIAILSGHDNPQGSRGRSCGRCHYRRFNQHNSQIAIKIAVHNMRTKTSRELCLRVLGELKENPLTCQHVIHCIREKYTPSGEWGAGGERTKNQPLPARPKASGSHSRGLQGRIPDGFEFGPGFPFGHVRIVGDAVSNQEVELRILDRPAQVPVRLNFVGGLVIPFGGKFSPLFESPAFGLADKSTPTSGSNAGTPFLANSKWSER